MNSTEHNLGRQLGPAVRLGGGSGEVRALWAIPWLLIPLLGGAPASAAKDHDLRPSDTEATQEEPAQPAPGKTRHVKSQQEYDAIQALANEKDPHKKLPLAEDFLKQFPDTELRDSVYVEMLVANAQLGDRGKALDAGRKAIQANPDSTYAFYNLGLVYLSPEPLDFDLGVWDLARSVALARQQQDKSAGELETTLTKVYVDYHGSPEGLEQLIAAAGGSPNPPDGFQVSGPKLYGPKGVSAESVRQGGLGSCYFHSTVAALAHSNPQLLQGMITDNANGTYTVRFPDQKQETVYPEDLRYARLSRFDRSDGQWVGVLFRAYAQRVLRESLVKSIDQGDLFALIKPYAKSFVESNDPLLLAYDRSIRAVVDQGGDIDQARMAARLKEETRAVPIPDEIKDSLLKTLQSGGAFDAVVELVKQNGEIFGAYRAIGHGGMPTRVIETLLGKKAAALNTQSRTAVAEFLKEAAPSKQPIVAATSGLTLQSLQAQKPMPGDAGAWYVEKHAYTLLGYNPESQTVTLRNPWGDHPDPDGSFSIPLATFTDSFEVIETLAP